MFSRRKRTVQLCCARVQLVGIWHRNSKAKLAAAVILFCGVAQCLNWLQMGADVVG